MYSDYQYNAVVISSACEGKCYQYHSAVLKNKVHLIVYLQRHARALKLPTAPKHSFKSFIGLDLEFSVSAKCYGMYCERVVTSYYILFICTRQHSGHGNGLGIDHGGSSCAIFG